ncbi:unnamed protein product [Scytosiphon promiscuus]
MAASFLSRKCFFSTLSVRTYNRFSSHAPRPFVADQVDVGTLAPAWVGSVLENNQGGNACDDDVILRGMVSLPPLPSTATNLYPTTLLFRCFCSSLRVPSKVRAPALSLRFFLSDIFHVHFRQSRGDRKYPALLFFAEERPCNPSKKPAQRVANDNPLCPFSTFQGEREVPPLLGRAHSPQKGCSFLVTTEQTWVVFVRLYFYPWVCPRYPPLSSVIRRPHPGAAGNGCPHFTGCDGLRLLQRQPAASKSAAHSHGRIIVTHAYPTDPCREQDLRIAAIGGPLVPVRVAPPRVTCFRRLTNL